MDWIALDWIALDWIALRDDSTVQYIIHKSATALETKKFAQDVFSI